MLAAIAALFGQKNQKFVAPHGPHCVVNSQRIWPDVGSNRGIVWSEEPKVCGATQTALCCQ